VPVVRVTGVLPQLRTEKLEGALMSYHSFLVKGSTLPREDAGDRQGDRTERQPQAQQQADASCSCSERAARVGAGERRGMGGHIAAKSDESQVRASHLLSLALLAL